MADMSQALQKIAESISKLSNRVRKLETRAPEGTGGTGGISSGLTPHAMSHYSGNDKIPVASFTNNGFLPKFPGDIEKFLAGDGNWKLISGGGSGGVLNTNQIFLYHAGALTITPYESSDLGLMTALEDAQPGDGISLPVGTITGGPWLIPAEVEVSGFGYDSFLNGIVNGPVVGMGYLSNLRVLTLGTTSGEIPGSGWSKGAVYQKGTIDPNINQKEYINFDAHLNENVYLEISKGPFAWEWKNSGPGYEHGPCAETTIVHIAYCGYLGGYRPMDVRCELIGENQTLYELYYYSSFPIAGFLEHQQLDENHGIVFWNLGVGPYPNATHPYPEYPETGFPFVAVGDVLGAFLTGQDLINPSPDPSPSPYLEPVSYEFGHAIPGVGGQNESCHLKIHGVQTDTIRGESALSDRSAFDAYTFPTRHANDLNTIGGLHHTIADLSTHFGSALTLGSANPSSLGSVSAGTSVYASHEDHVHPTGRLVYGPAQEPTNKHYAVWDNSGTLLKDGGAEIFFLGSEDPQDLGSKTAGNSIYASHANHVHNVGNIVFGPGSAPTDGHIVLWDGVSGKLVKDGGAPSGGGNVSDSGSTTDGHWAVFNGTNAHSIKDGGAIPSFLALGSANPSSLGAVAAGSATAASHEDHIHPVGNIVFGPSSAPTDGHLVLFDGVTGKLVKDGGVPCSGTLTKTGTVYQNHIAIWSDDNTTILSDGGYAPINGHAITLNGYTLTQRDTLNFYGDGVDVTDQNPSTDVEIKGMVGRRKRTVRSVNTNITIDTDDDLLECNSGIPFILNLYNLPNPNTYKEYTILNIGAGAVTVTPDVSDTIDGLSSIVVSQWQAITICAATLTGWFITGHYSVPVAGGNVSDFGATTTNHLAIWNGSSDHIIIDGGVVPSGNVVGPAGAPTDGDTVLFDGVTGKLLKSGGSPLTLGSSNPQALGSVAAGNATTASHENHVHPVGNIVFGPAGAPTDNHLAVFDGVTGKLVKDGGAIPASGVARSGATTDGHYAIWNGSNADSLKDGGAVGGGGNVSDTGATTANHLAVWNGASDHIIKDGGVIPTQGAVRSGTTTDTHLVVWNGSNADSIKDGGAVPTGTGNVSDTGATTANHLAVWNGASDHIIKDGGVIPTGNVVGPASAVDGHVALFDGVTGKLIKDGGAPGGGSGHTILDEGTPLTTRTKLNFVGSGVTATDDAGNDQTIVTIPFNSGSDFIHNVDGALAVVTNVAGFVVSKVTTISKVYLYGFTLGTSSSTIIDVHKNGTTIFTTQGSRPTLTWNDGDGVAVSATPDVVSLSAGDVLTIDIDQIAAGSVGLSICVVMTSVSSGSGNVTGPAGATDGHVALFDGASGLVIKDGGAPSTGGGADVLQVQIFS